MKEFIDGFLEYMIATRKKTIFHINTIKFVLLSRFKKKSLMYPSVASKWLKQFFELITMLGYGTYNLGTMELKLNEKNDTVALWIAKYIPKIEPKEETEKLDELIK